MRKIDLTSYSVTAMNAEGQRVSIPYEVKSSMEAIVLATGDITTQRLPMSELLKNARIMQKITNCEEPFILIEEHEYQVIKKAFEAFRGFGRNEVELCKRVDEAETVEVEEKKKKKSKDK